MKDTWIALAMCIALCSCTGNLRSQGSGSTGGLSGGTIAADLGDASLTRMRRLTQIQYKNLIADVFEGLIPEPNTEFVDVAVGGLPTAGAGYVGMPATDAEAFSHLANSIAQQVIAVENRPALVCQLKPVKDDDCLPQLVADWGKKLTRRPLAAGQKSRYLKLASDVAEMTNDPWAGAKAALSALLQSPFFLYQVDTVVGEGTDKTLLDDYSIASRISFLLTNRGPDEKLMQAADAGQLRTPQQVTAQAERLLSTPLADAALFNFISEMFELDKILKVAKDPNEFPDALRQDLETQIRLTVTDLLFTQNGDYRTLFTSKVLYTNDTLALRYGFSNPGSKNFAKITHGKDDRAGLFGLPGIGAALTPISRTSPTKRGEFIRAAVLCTTVPMPPPDVNTTIATVSGTSQTLRQIMTAHATNPQCHACHQLMDPIGFGLEGFDWRGSARTTDNGLPLDLSGELDGVPFANATGLGAALASNSQIVPCLVKRFILYATGNATATDDSLTDSLITTMPANGYQIKSLARNYVGSDIFLHAG